MAAALYMNLPAGSRAASGGLINGEKMKKIRSYRFL